MSDFIIRQARIVDSQQDMLADVSISNGKIVEIASYIAKNASDEVDANGLVLMPGGIDPHVHFNEPGRTEWEGLASGSHALAKGGYTSFFDMPLNSSPTTTTAVAYQAKRQLADKKSLVNAYLWGGLTPNNLDDLEELISCGVVGIKAFMSDSGIDEFPAVDDYTLYRGMKILASHGVILAIHAENDSITSVLAKKSIENEQLSVHDYLQSRPIIAELEAIQRAIFFAQETGCKSHIVHVSSAQGIDLVAEAKARGVDVSCETCSHYLVLVDSDVEKIGASAKCAPPIRSQAEQGKLWKKLIAGDIPMIASDHSPAPMALKKSDNFFEIWGGIASCQSTLSLLLTQGYHKRGMTLNQIVTLTSTNTAKRFGLVTKGAIDVGMDADLTLVDIDAEYILQADDLAYKHQISPYIGLELRGIVQKTWVGGNLVYG